MGRIIDRFENIIRNPKRSLYVAISLINCHNPKLISDKLCLKAHFYLRFGYELNLKNPTTFSEKLQWLKLYDRRPEFTKMVDKYEAKKYASSIIGEEYIIPTLGVWDRAEDIEWGKLPDQFVLKCTHDSGDLIICKDKSKLNKENAIKKLNEGIKRDYYKVWREWPYKNVPRRIIAEKYIEPAPDLQDLPDYKFFCFNGEPKYCQVISGRNTNMCCDFFDIDWNHQPFHEPETYPFSEHLLEKPSKYDEMWNLARSLAIDKPFSRIDFYEVEGKVYFGEITFFPTGGIGGFSPDKYDRIFGDLINIENI